MMSAKVEAAREQMAKVRANFNREVEAVRDNPSYSPEGRRLEIAKIALAYRKKAAGLREEFSATSKARRLELEKRLFGLPSGGDAIAYRDAVDRAEAIRSSSDAESMFSRAQRTGDTLLARAVAAQAFSKGWNTVTRGYAEEAGLDPALDELSDLRGGGVSSLGEAAVFSIGSPTELDGYNSTYELEKLVEQAA